MSLPGRIEGARDGEFYVIRQGDTVIRRIPIHEAMSDAKLARTIVRNGWGAL